MGNQIKLEITASAIAWYGAIVATIALFISAISETGQRGRITILSQI